ncbi:MAG: hypothetical protein NTX61_04555 [Bacteroidetes bacterium]|nr:hypothetical protein [Bacteroidota bacterium]
MGLDIKLPIGLMFSILGLLLTIFGFFTIGDQEIYKRSLGININLWSGLLMLIFGSVMLFFAFRTARTKKENPE